ncbi:MAG: pyruvate kinase [Gammaproteobacteria bacterium]|nr:pyruvate kinase [Gammaproteobacteria bacterium]MCY4218468.1 pyruvate kinase [Gammaproteobacteria bacterium]MCY4275802.1 pyruvate kinase [Gammaproteobacteria bacterium]
MRRNRKAKVVATLGPASSTSDIIEKLLYAGVDVFRLNFSHGNHDSHHERIQIIRKLEESISRPIGIMADIQGPKLRLGHFIQEGVELQNDTSYRLDLNPDPGDNDRAPLPHPEIFSALEIGSELLIDDGRVKLEVIRCDKSYADTRVIVGGTIRANKGVNIPNVVLPISCITKKDQNDLDFALQNGADWIAQSFVQTPEDVEMMRQVVDGRARIMVKLEKPSALESIDRILELSDGIMIARGDLGVELAPEQVPIAQKRIIRTCRQVGKPVVVATHMLDSMVSNPLPTRAEASDVSTAIYDGVDAVMLSAESAAGRYPVESVVMMNSIVEEVERDPEYRAIMQAQHPEPMNTTADAISNSIQRITDILDSAAATVTYTSSGSTSLRVARERPLSPILSITPSIRAARYMSLIWGVHPVVVNVANEEADVLQVIHAAKKIAVSEEFATDGQAVVITAGLPFGTSGTTNLIHVSRIGQAIE